MAMDPNVAMAIPTVVSIHPHPSWMQRMLMVFNDRGWRRDADDDLRKCGRRSETESKQPS